MNLTPYQVQILRASVIEVQPVGNMWAVYVNGNEIKRVWSECGAQDLVHRLKVYINQLEHVA